MKQLKVAMVIAIAPLVTCLSTSVASAASLIRLSKITCEDFIALDDVVKPKVVYWSEGFNSKGKPEDAVVDFGETDRLVPVLVQECTKTPKVALATKIKSKAVMK